MSVMTPQSQIFVSSLTHAGHVAPFTFPIRPSAIGFPDLDHAAEHARSGAEVDVAWLGGRAEVAAEFPPGSRAARQLDSDQLRQLIEQAIGTHSPETQVCQRQPDGSIQSHPAASVPVQQLSETLDQGGGILLHRAERTNEVLNRLAASVAVARWARVEAVVVLGSLAGDGVLPKMTRWHVVAMTEGTIVRPGQGAPFDAPPGTAVTVTEPPRIHAAPDSITLLVGEHTFDAEDHRLVLLERAGCHPLLRIDAPLSITEPVEIYGRAEPVSLIEHLRSELALVTASLDPADAAWWWLLRHQLAPAPMTQLISPGRWLRGRFPGGIGITERAEGGMVFAAAGQMFHGPDELLPFLTQMVSREPVDCRADDLSAVAGGVLLRAGLAEPVEPPIGH